MSLHTQSSEDGSRYVYCKCIGKRALQNACNTMHTCNTCSYVRAILVYCTHACTQWIYYSMRHVVGPRQHILATLHSLLAIAIIKYVCCVLDFLCCHLHRMWVNTLSSVINQVRSGQLVCYTLHLCGLLWFIMKHL